MPAALIPLSSEFGTSQFMNELGSRMLVFDTIHLFHASNTMDRYNQQAGITDLRFHDRRGTAAPCLPRRVEPRR